MEQPKCYRQHCASDKTRGSVEPAADRVPRARRKTRSGIPPRPPLDHDDLRPNHKHNRLQDVGARRSRSAAQLFSSSGANQTPNDFSLR